MSRINRDIDAGQAEHDIPARLDIAVGSIINALIFGYRWDEDHEEEFFELKRIVASFLRHVGHPAYRLLQQHLRFFMHFPFFKQLATDQRHRLKTMWAFYQRQIDNHIKRIDFETDSQPEDYAEAFLREKARRDKEGGEHSYTYHQLVGMCSDLFIAGQETTSTTLAWGFAYLLHSPENQKRLHEELDRVVGSDRLITNADRPNLPFTNAVICEIQRLCNLLPQNLLHRTTRDVVLDGYFLPAGTCVVPQISSVLYDEKLFSDPKHFNPTRFLDADGGLKRVDELIPFSIGKRQCLGEGLARMELFLFLANLFNQYKFSTGSLAPSLKRPMGVTVSCPGYTCRIEKRFK
ncbi:Protein CYP-33C1 [Aphelenchoides avenae]|nr:Protein CYP-33C1 [Aphelenchus avenae]